MKHARAKLLVGAVLVAGAGAYGYYKVYESPRADIDRQIDALRASGGQFEDRLDEERGTTARLEAVASTTLGATEAKVEARFRSSLGEIARHVGLTEVVANSGRARPAPNPAGASSPRIRGDFGRLLAEGADFYVIEGSLSGIGSLAQVLTALSTVQAQPWAHRVTTVSIKPANRERTQFEIRMDGISTLLTPDLVDESFEGPGWTPIDPREASRWAPIVEKNMFRTPVAPPPAPEPVTPEPEPDPPAPASPPYADWRLTGLPAGTTGRVAGFTRVSTGQSQLLEAGHSVLDAQLTEINRFSVVIEIEGVRYEVLIGQTLAERREIP